MTTPLSTMTPEQRALLSPANADQHYTFRSFAQYWPKIARYFGMETGPRRHISMVQFMADKGPVWDHIVAKHGLKPFAYDEIVRWTYGDFVFTPEYDVISSTTKLRKFGFHEVVDTEEMFPRLWDEMKAERILPG